MASPALNGVHPASAAADDDGLLTERLFIAVSPAMLKAINDYYHTNRLRSQSAAARYFLEIGMRTAQFRNKSLT